MESQRTSNANKKSVRDINHALCAFGTPGVFCHFVFFSLRFSIPVGTIRFGGWLINSTQLSTRVGVSLSLFLFFFSFDPNRIESFCDVVILGCDIVRRAVTHKKLFVNWKIPSERLTLVHQLIVIPFWRSTWYFLVKFVRIIIIIHDFVEKLCPSVAASTLRTTRGTSSSMLTSSHYSMKFQRHIFFNPTQCHWIEFVCSHLLFDIRGSIKSLSPKCLTKYWMKEVVWTGISPI